MDKNRVLKEDGKSCVMPDYLAVADSAKHLYDNYTSIETYQQLVPHSICVY